MKKALLPAAACLISFAFSNASPSLAQSVKRNPDGTVEVYDDDVKAAPAARAGSTKKTARASRGSGKIPAYTKRSGGVTIKRNADGTVDIIDNDMGPSPQSGRASAARKSRTGTSYGDGVAITRHADGTVDVHDTTMAAPSSGKRRGASVGAYTAKHGDVSVKRNADGTVDVVDTSRTTKRK